MSDRTGWSWYQFIGKLRSQFTVESSQSGRTESVIPKQGKQKDRSEIQCWYCKGFGHFRHQCECLKIKREEIKEVMRDAGRMM